MAAAPLSDFAVHLRPQDNVAVCRKPIPANTDLAFDGATIRVAAPIRMGHKFAVRPVKEGDAILKYGQIIGFAGRDIAAGEHVHVHNVKLGKFDRDYAYATETPPPPAPAFRVAPGADRPFVRRTARAGRLGRRAARRPRGRRPGALPRRRRVGRAPRRRDVRVLRGARVRRPLGDADGARHAPLSRSRRGSRALGSVRGESAALL